SPNLAVLRQATSESSFRRQRRGFFVFDLAEVSFSLLKITVTIACGAGESITSRKRCRPLRGTGVVLRRRATVEHSIVADATQSKNTSSIPALKRPGQFMPTLHVENHLLVFYFALSPAPEVSRCCFGFQRCCGVLQMLFEQACGRGQKIIGRHNPHQLTVIDNRKATDLGKAHSLDRLERGRGG